jgi:cytochrome c oxidase subunit 2
VTLGKEPFMSRPSLKWCLPALALAILAATASGSLAGEPQVIEVSAKRFEFVPSRITIRKGETVTLRLRSQDVTHGFFMKPLGIDATIEPGKSVDVTLTPKVPGNFTVICDRFCGAGHGNMHMEIVVE